MKLLKNVLLFTAVLSCGFLQAQVVNYALELDGTDRVDCGRITELNERSAYAVQFWMSPSAWVGGAYIFKSGSDVSEFSARLSPTAGEVIFKIGEQEIRATGVATAGWTQLTFAAFPNGADVWVNGDSDCDGVAGTQEVPDGKTWVANPNLLMPSLTGNLFLGENFRGRLDEFRLWNAEMPSSHTDNLMFHNTVNKFHPAWDNLILYYKFDQDQCPEAVVDYKNNYHGRMSGPINRVAVNDNDAFRYRVVSGYSSFLRHSDRTQIDRDMHLMTNDLLMLDGMVDGYTGKVTMTYPESEGVLNGGAAYQDSYEGRNGVLSLDGTGYMDIGKMTFRTGLTASDVGNASVDGWFYITEWVTGANLLQKKENDTKGIRIYLGDEESKELIVEINERKSVFTNALNAGVWQHIAVTVNAGSNIRPNKMIIAYVNNESVAGRHTGSGAVTVTDIDGSTLIGENFKGKIDDLLLWRNLKTNFATDMDGSGTGLKFPGGGTEALFLDGYWRFDDASNPGMNSRGWKNRIREIKKMYEGYRGFRIRIGLISSTSYNNGNKVWPDYIGREEWRNNLAADVAELIPYCDGIDVDFEWLDNNPANPKWQHYGEMVKALRKVIPADKVFSVSLHPVSYTLPVDDEVLGAIDYITFQNYGPRPANLIWSAYSAFYNTALNYGIPAEKIHLSMATTIVRTDGSGKDVKGYKDMDFSTITAASNQTYIGEVSYTFNGVDEVKKKMRLLVSRNAGGCMYFDMGNDISVQNELSLVRALNTVIASNVDLFITDVNDFPDESANEVLPQDDEITVYPIPAKDYVIVKGAFAGSTVCYELYTLSGRKIWSDRSAEPEKRIILAGISEGIYFLHVNNGKKDVIKKIQMK